MSRHLLSVAIIVSFAAVRAEAIEMFTNFHNGENLGFPPMEVPIGMYPGFGRGGWAPGVVGAPLRTMPPVPAMSPTGPAPAVFHRNGFSPVETQASMYPQQGFGLARNGRRQRYNLYNPMTAETRPAKTDAATPTETEAPRGLTVLKPQEASPPDLAQNPATAASNGEPHSDANSDSEAAAFFQGATAGW